MSTSGTSQEKLENCEVCGKEAAKYTCPKCEVRSCSLTCSNIHKKELNCDGIRDKTKYLPIKAITELELASEVGRCVDKYGRDPIKRTSLNNFLPTFLRKLKYAAFKRGVTLEFLPRSFSRNKENTTRFIWNKNELLWRIDWIFPQGENVKWTTEKASEKARLSVLLENVLEPDIKVNEDQEQNNLKSILRNKLQFYRSVGLNGIKVLMKAEKVQNSSSRFYELDLNLTLAENLEQKLIIEFPTFYVILKDHSDMYEMIDSDDEREDCEAKNFRHKKKFKGRQENFAHPPNKPQNLSKSNETEKQEGINFLFHTEFTDSEDEKGKMTREKNTKFPEKKRKFEKNPKQQLIIPKKMPKTRDSIKEFTGICMSDSEDEITKIKSISINSSVIVEKKSNEPEATEKPSEFFNSQITDSENEAPEEKPIERHLENKIQDEAKIENVNKNENCANSSIKNIAMNYFSAYMSESEEETIPEQTEESKNSGLQIPDYNVLVKMNN
ncbi:putative box C/D snoRNA protein SPCC613.07 isoform X2 [Leptopilina heterotoma]|uniref:putative box C/D snoRNA protein SPCC613.07 isoform X2 n=1 Tax=Leptopilina heterotoma TaxID=63436 RepID=UPI001CA8318E|nr:putative box C/D snoRNA protein SPCC613.07 isoform X2 [Leptopilina heterotoma]